MKCKKLPSQRSNFVHAERDNYRLNGLNISRTICAIDVRPVSLTMSLVYLCSQVWERPVLFVRKDGHRFEKTMVS